MDMLKLCNKCKQEDEETFHGYIGWVDENCYDCPICQSKMTDTVLTIDEYNLIDNISDDICFLEAMIKLKQDNIIEFQSRISQFKIQLQQQESNKKIDNTPKCPTCNSTNIEKISLTKKAVGGALFGLFSSNVRKTMHCKNCGYKW